MYCQKGVKCPFLTESLDVLQTLLSDEEEVAQERDEKTDVITIESDHEVAEEFGPKSTSPRKSRKVCMLGCFFLVQGLHCVLHAYYTACCAQFSVCKISL